MRIIKDLQEKINISNAVVTIGTFDGLHKGHRKLINRLKKAAEEKNGSSVVVTFHPHPRIVLGKDVDKLRFLTSFEERIELFRETGIDYLIILEFSQELAQLSSSDFIEKILLDKIGSKHFVIGFNHHFGSGRSGDFNSLQSISERKGFSVEQIPAVEVEEIKVSSTKIRNALLEGDVATANAFLEYDFLLKGEVVKGNQIGKDLGFPTANIEPAESKKLKPATGVYAVDVFFEGKKYGGMANIGHRPTLENKGLKTIEVHIFDFDGYLYNKVLEIRFIDRIREEKKFDGLYSLKEQLIKDQKSAREILKKHKENKNANTI